MPVYKAKSTIQHNGQEYLAGDNLLDLTEAQAAELLAAGVLEAPESENEAEAVASPATDNPPAQDEELERGQVDDQLAANVDQDLADAQKLADTPGDPVINNKARPGLASKLRTAVTGGAPATPPAAPAPTADQIANDPQLK